MNNKIFFVILILFILGFFCGSIFNQNTISCVDKKEIVFYNNADYGKPNYCYKSPGIDFCIFSGGVDED